MAITKEMLKRCQNELKQALCALPEDVQKAIMENSKHAIYLGSNKKWSSRVNPEDSFEGWNHMVFRLPPDTPTEPEWYENPVTENLGFNQTTMIGYGCINIVDATGNRNFLGIIYRKDGIETLRTSIDAAFGTPVRVRFSKP